MDKEEKIKIEQSTDYIVNKCKLIGNLNFQETFDKYRHISPKFSIFSNRLKSKLDENNYVELKYSILNDSLMEIIEYEEASLNLMYQGFYNSSVSLLRNCIEVFITHIYYFLKTKDEIYLNSQTSKEEKQCEYFDWKVGGRFDSFKVILKFLKKRSPEFDKIEEIYLFTNELSKFVHGRANINDDGLKVGFITNYFYIENNIIKYKEFHRKVTFYVESILTEYCQDYLK